jgi:hypothetical protein
MRYRLIPITDLLDAETGIPHQCWKPLYFGLYPKSCHFGLCPNAGHLGLYPNPRHLGLLEWGKTAGKAWGELKICTLPGAWQVDPGTKQGCSLGAAAALGAVAIAIAATAAANRDML